ncbi:MAG: sulfite exporter TauE/SafE family protein [Calditerrivibrio sp.]|nr:sulfite exporter TauE/SafE family protein [Calditerrivibrio sp.]MCA1933085.1 sulfite exporter TauE/SafE family protein [Calditerrivibrio sp.]MCA1980243.1 sulfite exporter TauE/SafE family protein [Calditerrivibrio sp.]
MVETILLISAGFVTGIIGALLGIGGGSLLVPILVIFFHYPMHTAVAAGLVTIIATSISTANVNFLKGTINLRLSMLLEFITVIFAILGGIVANKLNDSFLKVMFGVILSIVAFLYIKESIKPLNNNCNGNIKHNRYTDRYYDPDKGEDIIYTPVNIFFSSGVSALAGLASGMLGIGGGVFQVPAMNLISKMPLKVSIATSNYMIGLTAAGGSIPYITHGKILPFLSINMIIGVIFGSKFANNKFHKITDKKLKIVFAMFLLFVSLQMLYNGLK